MNSTGVTAESVQVSLNAANSSDNQGGHNSTSSGSVSSQATSSKGSAVTKTGLLVLLVAGAIAL